MSFDGKSKQEKMRILSDAIDKGATIDITFFLPDESVADDLFNAASVFKGQKMTFYPSHDEMSKSMLTFKDNFLDGIGGNIIFSGNLEIEQD